ncbi:MAG: hypothetical protein HYZ57_08535, partial [Acidobacteria bacterium]|nr:hypothetical protein [Acidobacteriota bacterium]
MPAQADSANLSVGQFAERYRPEMIPLGKKFSYFTAAVPLNEEELREYLEDPIAALPPVIAQQLPRVSILLVPYLERAQDRDRPVEEGEVICFERPAESGLSWSSCLQSKDETVLAFAVQDQEVADYHYRFYHSLAELTADSWTEEARREYSALIRVELQSEVHGEVDEPSWHLKQELLRRQKNLRKETKLFRDYVRQSFIDTLTLYLHGICCDIDVDP